MKEQRIFGLELDIREVANRLRPVEVPAYATPSVTIIDSGHQRDPYTVGIRVTWRWEETDNA